jgi:hypothetical protein
VEFIASQVPFIFKALQHPCQGILLPFLRIMLKIAMVDSKEELLEQNMFN